MRGEILGSLESVMSAMATDGFAVTVNRPRSHMGQAELRIGPDSVTLIARPIRHYRAVVASLVAVCTVLILIAGAFSASGQIALREPGLTGSARTEALWMANGAPVLVGVTCGLLVGGAYLLFLALRGDPRPIAFPLASVLIVKQRGRLLELSAPLDAEARTSSWTLAARNREDATAIASALSTGSG